MGREKILDHVLPEAESLPRLSALTVLETGVLKQPPDALLRLAAALLGGGEAAMAVATRLRLSNKERERLLALMTSAPVAPSPNGDKSDERSTRRLLQRLGAARFIDHLLLNWAEARTHGNVVDDAPWRALHDTARCWTPVEFPIKGEDAVTFGVPPGPTVGELIRAVEEWWAGEDFRPDRNACLAQLKTLVAGLAR
jgi:poly(A) polymerase